MNEGKTFDQIGIGDKAWLSKTLTETDVYLYGDTIAAEVEVIEKITEKNRIRLRTTCLNQDGKVVVEGEALVMSRKEVP